MPPKDAGLAKRRRNGSLSTPDELQDIKNVQEGRKFLEKFMLLCPPGEPATNESLSTCLHQIAAMAGMPKLAINAVRATALLLEEMEENATNETVKNAFDSQITEFTSDMKLLVDDIRTKIDTHLQEALEKIQQTNIAAQAAQITGNRTPTVATATYASTLINPPVYANPRIAAREGVKARQFLLDGAYNSNESRYDPQKLKIDLNKAAKEVGLKEGKIRSVLHQRDRSTLIEVDSDATAEWFTDVMNRIELCSLIGEGVTFRSRIFSVLVFNAPLNLDTEAHGNLVEIHEANELEANTIAAMRWAKPINRRSQHQKSAHLILSFTNPNAANRAISNGIAICHKNCHAERIKKEPIRCLKCQGWNHMAKDCEFTADTCSNCAEKHRTATCPCPRTKRCVSCKTSEHASWSRECPVFLKRVDDFNERNPENALPFFPTADPWTWSAGITKSTSPPTFRANNPGGTHDRQERQYHARPQERPRKVDTYFPSYGKTPEATPYDTPFEKGWGEDFTGPVRPSQQAPRPQTTVRFVNNSDTAGPSNPNHNTNLTIANA
jgi:hypothetical protein